MGRESTAVGDECSSECNRKKESNRKENVERKRAQLDAKALHPKLG